MSWWRSSNDDALVTRLDDHLRRMNFYEPVEHTWYPFSVQQSNRPLWCRHIQTVLENLQNTYKKACQFKAAMYCDDYCDAAGMMPLGKEAINLRKPNALGLLYDQWVCEHMVLYVAVCWSGWLSRGGHAILIVLDRWAQTWTPYDPIGRGLGLGYVNDAIKNAVQARLDEHWLLKHYRLVPQEKGLGPQMGLELGNNAIRGMYGSCTMVAMLTAMFMFRFNVFREPHVTRLMNNVIKLLQRHRRSISGSWWSNAKPDEEAFFIVLYGTWKKMGEPFPSNVQLTHPDDVNALCASLGDGTKTMCNRTVHSDRNTVWCYCEAHMKELLGPLILKDITFERPAKKIRVT